MKKYVINIMLILALLLSLATTVFAQEGTEEPAYPTAGYRMFLPMLGSAAVANTQAPVNRPLPEAVASAQMGNLVSMDNTLDRSLVGAEGLVQVSVHLADDPVVDLYSEGIPSIDPAAYLQELIAKQLAFLASIEWDYSNLGQAQRLLNTVMIEIDAAALPELAADPAVVAIKRVGDYEMNLSETVPYIGAAAVQDMGYTGDGVTVAVIDSGLDYTHEHFDGAGQAAYDANDETIIEPGTFPTDRVVGGYDYVGSDWPGGDLAPDPDPLDKPTYGDGHGTHVADIIGGNGGVAPGVDLIALKACSSIASACSGVALIESMEYAVDPDGDGRLNDAVDIINMSLGALYGNPFYDDLSLAVNKASLIGTLSVVAAGNADDKPYIHDTPGSAPTAIGVAATTVPSAFVGLMEATAPESIAGQYVAIWQSWSAPLEDAYPDGVEAPLQYGDGEGGNLDGCSLGDDQDSIDPGDMPFPAGSLDGLIVLVDRGSCNFSTKIYNVQRGGGLVGIIGMVNNDAPFDGALGAGGPFTIPGYMISMADSDALKSGLPDTVVKFDPTAGIDAVGTMESYSARGPSPWLNYIKPEIGAPSSSVSAVAGTGDGVNAFGGTSGATPMVAGSAALLKEALQGTVNPKHPDTPYILKSLLVNSGYTGIRDQPLEFFNGQLSPITRIGGGEVRVDQALKSPITLWEEGLSGMRMPTLSYGLQDVTGVTELVKVVSVNNWTNETLTYDLSATYRYEEDDNGAVTFEIVPEELVVPPMGPGKAPEANFLVKMIIDGEKLGDWSMNSGSAGASGATLTANEYDGYLWLDDTSTDADDGAMIHMPWHVLPRKSLEVTADPDVLTGWVDDVALVEFSNTGVQETYMGQYDWIAHSEQLDEQCGMGENCQTFDIKDVGVMTYPVPAGFCSGDDSFVMEFVITTYDRQASAIPSPVFDVMIDVDRDGQYDYNVFNFDLSLSSSISDGRSVTWVAHIESGAATAFFFLGHTTNSANYTLTFCGEQIGMNAANFFEPMDIDVLATDWYSSGDMTDIVLGLEISPLGERYWALGSDVAPFTSEIWQFVNFGAVGTNPTSIGALMLTGDATAANENMTLPAVP